MSLAHLLSARSASEYKMVIHICVSALFLILYNRSVLIRLYAEVAPCMRATAVGVHGPLLGLISIGFENLLDNGF